jgi:serine/threonine-protein kinase
MAATAPASSIDFLDLVKKCGVLNAERMQTLPKPAELPQEVHKAAQMLVQLGFLTRFQATHLLAGRFRGFRVGQYVLLGLLGRGGMGTVYQAEHIELNRKVALKVLSAPEKGEDHKLTMERFLREARAAAALDHPNIVRIFDVNRYNGIPYLVMEYVDGETLQQTLERERRLPHGLAAEYIAQAAAGLQHAHEKSFIHRDIKPANLIRDRASGVVKILDMGLARSTHDSDKLTERFDEGAVVGTADFIAPEQAINSPNVDARADIYSLGATLYMLVVGKTPFAGSTTQKLLQHQLKDAPPLCTVSLGVPEELSDVVAKMLAKKPADRFQTAGEVIAALAPWAADSSRVLAGISRTNLGGGDSQAALQQRLSTTSKRLTGKARPSASDSSVDTSGAGKATAIISSDETTHDYQQHEPAPTTLWTRQRTLMIGAIGAAIILIGGLVGWLASGRGKAPEVAKSDSPSTQIPTPQPQPPTPPQPQPQPQTNPNPNTNPTPKKPPIVPEQTLLATNFTGLKPFVVRSGITIDPADPNKKNFLLISQTGAGALPSGWFARCWNKDTEMEAFSETIEGRPVVGIRNVRGPGAAMLFTPRFECPSGVVRLKLEYAAHTRAGSFNLRFKSDDQRGAWDVVKPATDGAWRSEEWLVDLKGAAGGYFELHNNDASTAAYVQIRSISIVEPTPAVRDQGVFKLDAFDLPGFRNIKMGKKKTSGEDDPNLKDVYFGGWKPETESEWVCGPIEGVKAVGLTNLNDVMSAQIGIELEYPNGVEKFIPGQYVRMRVTYRTSGKGRGNIYFQNSDDHKVFDRASLPNSNNEWKTVELVTQRKEHPLRCVVDTSEQGSGNTLYVRSITVAAVGEPHAAAVAPPPNPALDPGTWAEGATLYSLDVPKIPQFRTQKEKSKRLGGDTEQLPKGVGCQCWKEGAVGEFRRDVQDGVPALGVTNLNNEKSSQFFFQLEAAMGLTLQPGKAYRVKVKYRTDNEAAGIVLVHVAPSYKIIASAKMDSASQWKTATMSFVRPPAEDKVDVRMVIDNTTVGEGNTLWFRSLELVELITPTK